MHRLFSTILTLALSSCWAAAGEFSAIDAKIEAHLAKMNLPGAGLLVIHEGEVIHESFFGDYEPKTVIPIASASKWLSAATVMTLVDEGKIELEKPISTYLPAFDSSEKGQITTRHLLSHTSGMSSSHILPGAFLVTPHQCANLIANEDLASKPGEFFAYGGYSLQVAAGIAENKTGQSWQKLFADRITKPLEMKATTFGREGGLNRNPMAAGGGFSNLRDYGKFMQMLSRNGKTQAGEQLLSEEAVEAILSQQTSGAAPKNGFDKMMAGFRKGHDLYGLGCWIDRVDADGRVLAASSPGAFGFTPWIDREFEVSGVFMVQTDMKSFMPTMKLVGEIQKAANALLEKK
ncbi:MAG: D-alanyl-D-alanine-carboxypeptidase/D-alanyl-D-alanine-endopeptidase [Verrucomicrobiales bacterium]